jgi:coronin-1B/1C/6
MKDGRILTTGFTRRSERMYALRDEEALDEPIVQEELDTSNGVLLPLYDADTGLLYLVGKGDCSIRYYEVNDDAPFIHYINTHTASEPQRGIGFMPKLGLHIADNEISRVYKFTNKGVVEVLPFFVPRKSELFQDDLYPPTAGTKPALTAEQWMQGMNADPILVPLSPGAADSVVKKAPVKKANILADMSQSSGANDPTSSQQSSAAPPPAKPSMRLAQSAPKERYEPAVSVPADSGIVLNTSKAHKPADTAVIGEYNDNYIDEVYTCSTRRATTAAPANGRTTTMAEATRASRKAAIRRTASTVNGQLSSAARVSEQFDDDNISATADADLQ